MHFYFGTHILSFQFKELYKTILMNENLIKENKRLIEVFPEGVLIQKPISDTNDQL